MELDLSILDLEGLKQFRAEMFREHMKLKVENKTENQDKIKQLAEDIKKYQVEINKRVEKLKKDGSSSEVAENKPVVLNGNPDLTRDTIKNISHTLHNQVPIFSSGHDIHVWLNKLDIYYQLYVAKSDHKDLMEKHFVQTAKGQICVEYLNNMGASGANTDTYDGLKAYMKQHHASKVSVYQILDKCWEMSRNETETLRDFGIRLDDRVTEATNIIEAKFKEWAESESRVENTEITVKDYSKVMSGQMFLQVLKNQNQNIYNFICNDLDKTWSGAEIANKAMTYSDRLTSEESQNQGTVPSAFPAKHEDKSSNPTRRTQPQKSCAYYLTSGCWKGVQCDKYHDEALKNFLQKEKRVDEGEKDEKKKPFRPWGRNKKDKKKPSDSNTGVDKRTVAAAKVPMPTQDFRN